MSGTSYAAAVAELAQVNVAVMRGSIDSPVMAGFAFAFDAVARLAEESPGFVWRLSDAGGHITVTTDGGHAQVVNVSVWRDYPSLHRFVYRSLHGGILGRRREWFLPAPQPSTALWWVDDGHRPSVDEALARLLVLRRYGPSPRAFSSRRRYDGTGRPVDSRHRLDTSTTERQRRPP